MITISKALERALRKRKWKHTRLAAELGLSEAAVRGWLTGRTEPHGKYMVSLMHVLPEFAEIVLNGAKKAKKPDAAQDVPKGDPT